ncbi:FAD-dependent oxidoreductase [Phormidium sp. CLA17]|uniref:FAD-dependent oxidoreductase n=1 Tax=Leptolyngbya sp. Cla-17 TaxID=2803751 RepID=UPI001491B71F|nr:FAD-dependent oxidoreductase [Leptolyngbya sp. Cla-17]MBM0741318.1 FAD-dependent oxidoreductase [Leptolyngbya sp. Cla-17]
MSKTTRVIVVGAGIAGLAAASRLQSFGYTVTVLEGRDRIGGRIHTDRSWGVPVELGATWVHGMDGNPVMDLAQQWDLETVTTDYENLWLYDTKGVALEDDDQVELEEQFWEALDEVEELVEQMDEENEADISLQTALDIVLSKWELSAQDRRELDYAIASLIEHEYAADSADLSCYHWDEGEEFDGEDGLFPKGYDQLVTAVAKDLDIRLEHPVKAVEYQQTGVRVQCQDDTFEADYAIVTVPLGVLKAGSVTFSPALPDAKQKAIHRLGMGTLNKVVLRFPKMFWEKSAEVIGYIPKKKGEWVEFFNFYPITKQPILVGFNAGSYAQTLEDWSDEKVVAAAMQTLRTIYGAKVPNPTHHCITRWRSDPFTQGAYSFLATHATDEDYDRLAEPVGDRLFFAGEATSRQYAATVHGALLSGWREADRIHNLD